MYVHLKTPQFDYGKVRLIRAIGLQDYPMLLAESDESPYERLSVNLSGYGMFPKNNNVFVKDYSEHEGLTEALVELGAVKVVREVEIGYGKGYEVEVSDEIV